MQVLHVQRTLVGIHNHCFVLVVLGEGNSLPADGEDLLAGWWWEESRQEGGHADDATRNGAACDSHVVRAEVARVGEEVRVTGTQISSVFVELLGASLEEEKMNLGSLNELRIEGLSFLTRVNCPNPNSCV